MHDAPKLSRPKLLDELFQAHVESKIDAADLRGGLSGGALAARQAATRGKPGLTERFELFANGQGAGERLLRAERPASTSAQRFEAQARLKAAGDEEATGVDEDYLRAMEYGMPPTGGVGIGIDRLLHVPHRHAAHPRRDPLPAMRPE